jgi:hypothetical protein
VIGFRITVRVLARIDQHEGAVLMRRLINGAQPSFVIAATCDVAERPR